MSTQRLATLTANLPEGEHVKEITVEVKMSGGATDGVERKVALSGVFGQHVADALTALMDEIRVFTSAPNPDWRDL